MLLSTSYIFPGLDEQTQMASAKKHAQEHPDGLANVCYHRHGESHNERCYTFDINQEDEEEGSE